MSDSEDDFLGGPPAVRGEHAMDVDARPRKRSTAEVSIDEVSRPRTPDFLREMIKAEKRRKEAEARVNLQTRDERDDDGEVQEILSRARGFFNDTAGMEEAEEDADPFFLYCPPVKPVFHLPATADSCMTVVASPAEVLDFVHDLSRAGNGRVCAPFTPAIREVLASLAVLHEDESVRAECRGTLCDHLKADAGAWASLQGVLLRALCDLGFPEGELGTLQTLVQGAQRSCIQYAGECAVRVYRGAGKNWCKGQLLGPVETSDEAGRGQRFWVQLHDGENRQMEVVIPSEILKEDDTGDHSDGSEEDADSDCDRQSAPLSSSTAKHLYPLLLLLQSYLESGAARELTAARAWFSVLLPLLLHTGNARCFGGQFKATFLEAGSTGALGSPAEAAAACMEALLACIPHENWPSFCSELCDFVISRAPAREERRASQEDDLLLSVLRRRWPVTPRAAELHGQIVQAKLIRLLTRDASGEAPWSTESPQAGLGAEVLYNLLKRISLRPPADQMLLDGANDRKFVVYVNGVGALREEFVRILHYVRLALQRIAAVSPERPNLAIRQEIYSHVDTWHNHVKGALQCKMLIQRILQLGLFQGCR